MRSRRCPRARGTRPPHRRKPPGTRRRPRAGRPGGSAGPPRPRSRRTSARAAEAGRRTCSIAAGRSRGVRSSVRRCVIGSPLSRSSTGRPGATKRSSSRREVGVAADRVIMLGRPPGSTGCAPPERAPPQLVLRHPVGQQPEAGDVRCGSGGRERALQERRGQVRRLSKRWTLPVAKSDPVRSSASSSSASTSRAGGRRCPRAAEVPRTLRMPLLQACPSRGWTAHDPHPADLLGVQQDEFSRLLSVEVIVDHHGHRSR